MIPSTTDIISVLCALWIVLSLIYISLFIRSRAYEDPAKRADAQIKKQEELISKSAYRRIKRNWRKGKE